MVKYNLEMDPKKTAKAKVDHAPVSRKDTIILGKYLKGRNIDKALNILRMVIDLEFAIPYPKYNDSRAHKPGKGPGRYPVQAAKQMLELLESAKKNAQYKGLDLKNVVVGGVNANKGYAAYRPRRASLRGTRRKSTHITLFVEEKAAKSMKAAKTEKPTAKKTEAKAQ
jgi:large subunit ribosomal protein L22